MVDFTLIELEHHKAHLIKLNEEYLSWIVDVLQQRYNINLESILGENVQEYAKKFLQEISSFLPPKGIYYIIQEEGSIIGMGALRKLKKSIGEIKRMYIQPEYRGNGYGKKMLELLLKKGKELDFSSIRLDTGEFMTAAHQVYRLAGFREREQYPETEVPLPIQHLWLYMEKFISILYVDYKSFF